MSFEGRKHTFLRGNWTMCEENSQIAQTLRLFGGPSRERTILHRRIPVNNPNMRPNWSNLPSPVIRPEGVNERIGDLAQYESKLPETLIGAVELWKLNALIRL